MEKIMSNYAGLAGAYDETLNKLNRCAAAVRLAIKSVLDEAGCMSVGTRDEVYDALDHLSNALAVINGEISVATKRRDEVLGYAEMAQVASDRADYHRRVL